MNTCFRALCLVLFAGWVAGLATLAAPATGAPLTRYDIEATLDPLTQSLVGAQRVDYVNDTAQSLGALTFRLLANWGAAPNPYLHPALQDAQYVAGFDPTWTRILGVADADDHPLPYRLEPSPATTQTYSLDDGLCVVDLPEPLAPGERVVVRIRFETRFARALTIDNAVYRGTYVWRFGWNPIAVPAEAGRGFVLPAADYHLRLHVPQTHQVFGGADHQATGETIAGLTIYTLDNDRPARSVPLLIGPDLRAISSTWNGVELVAVHLPGGDGFARLALSHLGEILAAYSERFGPVGYARVVVAESPTPGFYGLAADGMLLVGRSLVRLKDMPALGVHDRFAEYLLAHEAAHLWWGIGIGTDFDAENWISEGFAEYLSIGFFEEKYGAFEPNLLSQLGRGLVEDLLREELGYLNLRRHAAEAPYLELLRLGFDEAIVKPLVDVDYLNGLAVRTYNKGYLVLRALEAVIGRDALHAALREASARWRGEIVDVEGFRRLAEGVSGIDLGSFFADWLYGDARLDLAVDGFDATEADGRFATVVRLRRVGTGLPVEVAATLADGSTVRRLWHAARDEGEVLFETASPVLRVQLDPDELLPDANRFNNHFPRRVLVDHPFRSRGAPPIGVPLDAYVIDISPFQISGRFRTDHAWSVAAMPRFPVPAASVGAAQPLSTWDVAASFAASVSRTLSLSASAEIVALDLAGSVGAVDARITLHVRRFTHPETGTAGTYWDPSRALELTFGVVGDLFEPVPYVAVAVRRSDQLRSAAEHAVLLQVGVPGFGHSSFATLAGQSTKRFRLAPLLYLDLSAAAGSALSATVPTPFLLAMDELRAFPFPPHGHHQLFGRVEFVLPPVARDVGYAVFNLTRIEDVTASAFVQGGRTWGGCDRACEPGLRLEVGGELTFRLAAILGASIDLTVGYAHPLAGPNGRGTLFFAIAAPF